MKFFVNRAQRRFILSTPNQFQKGAEYWQDNFEGEFPRKIQAGSYRILSLKFDEIWKSNGASQVFSQ